MHNKKCKYLENQIIKYIKFKEVNLVDFFPIIRVLNIFIYFLTFTYYSLLSRLNLINQVDFLSKFWTIKNTTKIKPKQYNQKEVKKVVDFWLTNG